MRTPAFLCGITRKRAAMARLRGVEDAAPYVGDCPLVGGHANLRRGEGTPPYELWKSGM